MAMEYTGDLTCSLGVSKLPNAIEWYEKTLGFTLLYKVDEIAWAEMKSPVDKVNLGLSQVETVVRGGGVTPTWGVPDIAAAKAHLDAHDVRQDGDIQHIPNLVKLLTFYDPDGNSLMVFEDLQGE